jgi:hypothetical protein
MVFQDRTAAGSTTTEGISETYKNRERLSPIALVEHIDDLLVPNQRTEVEKINPKR